MRLHVRTHVLVCTGAGCIASGALEVSGRPARSASTSTGLADEVKVVETGCLGPCAVGPVAVVYPDGVFYQNLKPEDAGEIVEEHLLKGRVVERLVHKAPATGERVPALQDIGFFQQAGQDRAAQLRRDRPAAASRSTSPATATRRWPRR